MIKDRENFEYHRIIISRKPRRPLTLRVRYPTRPLRLSEKSHLPCYHHPLRPFHPKLPLRPPASVQQQFKFFYATRLYKDHNIFVRISGLALLRHLALFRRFLLEQFPEVCQILPVFCHFFLSLLLSLPLGFPLCLLGFLPSLLGFLLCLLGLEDRKSVV